MTTRLLSAGCLTLALCVGALNLTLIMSPASAETGRAAGTPAVSRAAGDVRSPSLRRARIARGTGRGAVGRRPPKGYGFLPGYEDPIRPRVIRRPVFELRYFDRWGRANYGYGRPGFFRGRWNGGSMGPCWKSTPIGAMWTCG